MSAEDLEHALELERRAQLLVDSLTEEEARHLFATLSQAREEYAEALTRFADGVVAALPRPLRGRAARILARS